MGDAKIKMARGGVVYPTVDRAMKKIGEDISLARRVRRIAADDFARRIGISRATLHRLESGDPGIGLNTLAMALHALGRLDAFTNIADPVHDHVTMMQMRDQAPKRISKPRGVRDSEMLEGTVQEPLEAKSKFVGF
ncbi:helix-turn-helix domain-containing protein [Pararhizobium sp. PWRC1-1]|uniref:helix-turn-helix domain-containing protein n=1 Tax=Pararhizobium sp. PWRC1-1 TaxID=2804566 RepID=UPI003CF5D82E